MDALLMCGGQGVRLDADVEKPLFQIAGRPMIDRVIEALEESSVETFRAVVSPHVPRTRAHLDLPTIDAPGDGYVEDLAFALDRVDAPVLSVAADLPLLDADAVDAVLEAHRGGSLAVCVPAARKRSLGLSTDAAFERGGRELVPAGINVVDEGDDGDDIHVVDDVALAANVNRRPDAAIVEGLL